MSEDTNTNTDNSPDPYDGMTATYSPDDNKLRLYAMSRLGDELYQRVRAAGFRWAPKQGLFVCPRWTPTAEDLLLEMCGEVDDEDQSKEERSADRADRFGDYRDKRRGEAGGHADTFESGPQAFGHQNQQRAERQSAKHDRQRTWAVCQWSKAEYWQERTAAVISHALHRASPRVRRMRIKRLETELRNYCNGSPRWAAHYELRLTYERAMLATEGGSASDVDMIPGGFIGKYQIEKLNRSKATGKIVSIGVWSIHEWKTRPDGKPIWGIHPINIERLEAAAYRAPTAEELEAFTAMIAERKSANKARSKATPGPKLINPTLEDAQRIQDIWNNARPKEEPSKVHEMTQAHYSARSKGTYARYETVPVTCTGTEPRRGYGRVEDLAPIAFKIRKAPGGKGFYSAYSVVVITDKPQNPVPWAAMETETAKLPTLEGMTARIV